MVDALSTWKKDADFKKKYNVYIKWVGGKLPDEIP